MQITEISIKNLGAIEEFNISFEETETPVPVLFVGGNGTGKTLLLSVIADAIIELAKKHYQNITSNLGMTTTFFRISGSVNNCINMQYNYSYIKFNDLKHGEAVFYDRAGDFPDSSVQTSGYLFDRFSTVLHSIGKGLEGELANENNIENLFSENVLCYFPPSRHEKPFWINDSEYQDINFYAVDRFAKRFNREIILESTWSVNRAWLTSVYLDSLSDVESKPDGSFSFRLNESIRIYDLRRNRDNAERILSTILRKDNISLYATLRNTSQNRRLAILEKHGENN